MKKEFGVFNLNYVGQGNIEELTAKEMFERLGYVLGTGYDINDNVVELEYYKKQDDDLSHKIVFLIYYKVVKTNDNKSINMQELEAIIQQCKELGWL